MNELLIGILATIISASLTWFLSRRKTEADIKKTQSEQNKLDAESEKIAVDSLSEALSALRSENIQIHKELKRLTYEIQIFKRAFSTITHCEHSGSCPAHAILYGETCDGNEPG